MSQSNNLQSKIELRHDYIILKRKNVGKTAFSFRHFPTFYNRHLQLEKTIVSTFNSNRKSFGTRRIKNELNKLGIIVSRRKIGRIMKKYNKEFDNKLIDEVLKTFNIKRSLSTKGCPYDNAVAEATMKAIKTEFVKLEPVRNRII